MHISFEADVDETIESFMDKWENPTNPLTIATNSSFVEFKVNRLDNLFIVTQTNIYDVVSKFLVFSGVGLMFLTYLIALATEQTFYAGIWFKIGLGVVFVGVLWLSPYYRYILLYLRLRMIGYKGKIKYVNNSYVVSKLLNEREYNNGSKRDI